MNTSAEAAELRQERGAAMTVGRIGRIAAPGKCKLQALASPPGLPDYLVRHYAWAYVWPPAVWFFDHQPIINAILFGQYRRIMTETMRLMEPERTGRTLQIAAVYGELTPKLAEKIEDLYLIDVAPVQLRAARRKVAAIGRKAHLARMNCESLTYGDASFDTALMFLLLHELPAEARRRTLREAVRVLRPGGRLVIAEYGELGPRHLFHRLAPFRRLLEVAEPFLDAFWREDLVTVLRECAAEVGRTVELDEKRDIFAAFYRVLRFRVS